MQIRSFLAAGVVATFLVGCGGGDINISPSNVDNSVDNSTSGGGGGSGASICASYEKDGVTVYEQQVGMSASLDFEWQL